MTVDELETIKILADRFIFVADMSGEDIASTIRDIVYNAEKLAEYKWMYEELSK